jgi:quinolinate synthase
MRLNTLEKVYLCMLNESPQINLDPEIAKKARIALDRMISGGYKALESA